MARKAPGLGLRRGKLEQRTLDTITRIIVHHTGVGVLGRYKREQERRPKRFHWSGPLDAAVHVYQKIMNASGHYVVGYMGEVVQCVPDDFAAWHAGYGGQRRRSRLAAMFDRMRYARKLGKKVPRWLTAKRYQWWREKWYEPFGHESPCVWFPDLDVNGCTIGIELLSTPGQRPFSTPQLEGAGQFPGLAGLVKHLSKQYGIPIDADHILTHSDVCPLARTTKSGNPWDPPPSKGYSFGEVFKVE
jgi:hypothetical protein